MHQCTSIAGLGSSSLRPPGGSEINHGIHRGRGKRESESTSPFRVLPRGGPTPAGWGAPPVGWGRSVVARLYRTLGMIGVSVTMMKRDRVARSVRHDPRARVAELADAQDLGSCPARGEGSNPSSRTPPSEAVRLRQNQPNYKGKPSSTPVRPDPIITSVPERIRLGIRPRTATRNATRLLPDAPDLAAVVAA